MTAGAELAALLGSRICHDLISPLGAIGNGVELMMMGGGSPAPELALIADSVAAAQARIRFLRVAVGTAGSSQPVGAAEIADLLSGIYGSGRIAIDWQPQDDLPRRQVRRAFLALMCLQDALPLGGTITVARSADFWQFTACGPKLRSDPAVWGLLAGEEAAGMLVAAQVQFGLLHADLLSGPGPAAVEITEDRLHLAYPVTDA